METLKAQWMEDQTVFMDLFHKHKIVNDELTLATELFEALEARHDPFPWMYIYIGAAWALIAGVAFGYLRSHGCCGGDKSHHEGGE